jgi:hypothetical protein
MGYCKEKSHSSGLLAIVAKPISFIDFDIFSQSDIVPSHIQHLTGDSTARTEPNLSTRMLFKDRRSVKRVVLHVFRLLTRSGLGHRRHFRNAVLVRVRGALCHTELLFEALLCDARRLLVYPRVDGAEARDRGALRHEAVAPDVVAGGDGVAAGIVRCLWSVRVGPAEATSHCAAEAWALGDGRPVGEELAECGRRGECRQFTGLVSIFESLFVTAEGPSVLC